MIRVRTAISDLSSIDFEIFESKANESGQSTYKVDIDLVKIVEDQLGYMHFSVLV